MKSKALFVLTVLMLMMSTQVSAGKNGGKYLFAYFSGNRPQQEQLAFAISDDGLHYVPLNSGKPVLGSDSIAVSKGIRDPHILRGRDGWFYMVMTDMRSSLGWDSNRGMVMLRSRDLIHWEHHTVHFPTRFGGTLFAHVTRVWAPQTIYDKKAHKYMVYFSILTNDGKCPYDRVYWAYANSDFSDLEGIPQVLYDAGQPTIDTDIVQDAHGTFHLFFKTEGAQVKGIKQYTFKNLHDTASWRLQDGYCQQTAGRVEGSGVFPLLTGGWCLMYDCYSNGHYQFCSSPDLYHFSFVCNTDTHGAFTPRHGTVMTITDEEAERLRHAWSPDSVYLFSYSRNDGNSGLRFAFSPDNRHWSDVGDGYDFVKSDFGSWGTMKKMYRPMLVRDEANQLWRCFWTLTPSGKSMAYADSPDLMNWHPQVYFPTSDLGVYSPSGVVPPVADHIVFGGETLNGYTQRVPSSVVDSMLSNCDARDVKQKLDAERTFQDAHRFAGLKSVNATLDINLSDNKCISDLLTGIFFEDINYSADGGLYAELVQNRDFEYSAADKPRIAGWSPLYSWSTKGDGIEVGIDSLNPIHPNNAHYAAVHIHHPGASLVNAGYDGIRIKKGEKYDCSFFVRAATKSKTKFLISLIADGGNTVAKTVVSANGGKWMHPKVVLTATADADSAALAVTPLSIGTYHFDMVSLFPENTFHGRSNGMRADLAQTLADLHPRFMRFPGGCVSHGDGIDNIYRWKETVGPLESRKPLRNIWGYHQSRGLGFFEFMQFCEDIGAEPLPVLAAGVPCQNSSTPSHCSVDELTTYGQQGGIPMKEMKAYVQDILDLIEYANGDAATSEWARMRAEAGHPAPFHLKYLGIGNEDLISGVFKERFRMIYEAVRAKYPDITIVGTVGPFYEGSDYEEGWKFATELQVPVVDEHYYVSPGWMLHNQNRYDHYDRSRTKVYLGEYAASLPKVGTNLETALAEALYLTSIERNGDVVMMTSYAPLLARRGHTQWNPDMIYFDNKDISPTVSYYVQKMYGNNSGDEYINAKMNVNSSRDDVKCRIATSVVRDGNTGDIIVKMVNMLPCAVVTHVTIPSLNGNGREGMKTVLTGMPDSSTAMPLTSTIAVGSQFDYSMPPYSFTVIRIGEK